MSWFDFMTWVDIFRGSQGEHMNSFSASLGVYLCWFYKSHLRFWACLEEGFSKALVEKWLFFSLLCFFESTTSSWIQILYYFFFCVVLCWILKIQRVDILNIFLIYFKTSKFVVISILLRHSREIPQRNPIENPSKTLVLGILHGDDVGACIFVRYAV